MSRRPLMVFAALTLATWSAVTVHAEGIDTAERVAWRYTQKELTVTISHAGGKEWVARRSDGTNPLYDEVERTDDYVQLQNRESKLLIRLHEGQAYWRRPKDAEWTRWVKGGWVLAPAPADGVKPVAGEHRVRLAYFVPRDRKPVAQYEQR